MGEGLHAVELCIPGECGQLEGRLLFREETTQGTGAILCPPHPLLAGNIGHETFGLDQNQLVLFDADGHTELPRADKQTLARQLIAHIAQRL